MEAATFFLEKVRIMKAYRALVYPISILTAVISLLISFQFTSGKQSGSNWFCGQHLYVKDSVDTIPALVIQATGEVWFLDPVGQSRTEETLGQWPPIGSYVAVADPEVVDGWLYSVSQFMEVPNCETNSSQPTSTPFAKFWPDRYELNKGECTWLHWNTENVRAVYLNEEGVIGNDSRQVCPETTTSYKLDAIISDTEAKIIGFQIEVIEPAPTEWTDAASLDSQSEYPTVSPGQVVHLSIVVRNSGSSTWKTTEYNFRGTGGWEGWNNNLWRDVPPGTTITFEADVTAPQNPGDYDYGFMLYHTEQKFGPHFFLRVFVRTSPTTTAQPTAQATVQPATPTPTTTGQPVVVIQKGVNLRAGTSTFASVLFKTTTELRAEIIGKDESGKWLLACCYAGADSRFWIGTGLLPVSRYKVEGSITNLPVIKYAKQVTVKVDDYWYKNVTKSGAVLTYVEFVNGNNQYDLKGSWTPYNCQPATHAADDSDCVSEVTTENSWWQGEINVKYKIALQVLGVHSNIEDGECTVIVPEKALLNTVTLTVFNKAGEHVCEIK